MYMNNMSNPMQDSMAEATRLTREGRVAEATALIQRTFGGASFGSASLGGRGGRSASAPSDNARSREEDPDDKFRRTVNTLNTVNEASYPTPSPEASPQQEPNESALRRIPRTLKPSRSSGRPHRFAARGVPTSMPGATPGVSESVPKPSPSGPPVGRFITRSYTNRAGTRAYKLYIPSGYVGQAVPLVVMLHGCTQGPDDFATGTRMNGLAEEKTFLVAYPAQVQNANMSKCWNWFKETDQQRGEGEPSILAGITREICEEYDVADGRVYVAGMSAGGAMAAILGSTYPDLYAAVGVHSGLAPGAARDLPSAFSAMQGGQGRGVVPHRETSAEQSTRNIPRSVPLIVFHGDHDTTVHPRNADHLLAHYGSAPRASADTADKTNPQATARQGRVPGGYSYTRQARHDTDGRAVMERWAIHGLGHAWSGGSGSGSYTDPKGPDATSEMMRFFDQHSLSPERD